MCSLMMRARWPIGTPSSKAVAVDGAEATITAAAVEAPRAT